MTPLDYSPTSHAGYTGTRIGVIKDDTIVLQGTPMTTDGEDGPVTPYTAPTIEPPPNGIPNTAGPTGVGAWGRHRGQVAHTDPKELR